VKAENERANVVEKELLHDGENAFRLPLLKKI
jgi:hypothetical protein